MNIQEKKSKVKLNQEQHIKTEGNNLTHKIAKFIREKRVALGLSQKEFAELIFNDPNKRPYIT